MPKEINVSVGTLIELKAELHRKRNERKLATEDVDRSLDNKQLYVKKRSQKDVLCVSKKEKETKCKESDDRKKRIEQLEEKLREEEQKSKDALTKKARLYDRLTQGDSITYEDGKDVEFMVDFGKKSCKSDDVIETVNECVGDLVDSSQSTRGEEEWVEYEDSFGRRRCCLKEDLRRNLEKDIEFARESERRMETDHSSEVTSDKEQNREIVSQQKNVNIGPVHYSSVAEDEPRDFGVSHFKFDKSEERRTEQMQALEQLRQQTIDSRNKSEQLKRKRERLMAERLEKVRKRKNLEPNGDLSKILESDQNESLVDDIPLPEETTADEHINPPSASLVHSGRPAHVRPWDRGKNTFSQEKWVEKKRCERDEEFAPPSSYFS